MKKVVKVVGARGNRKPISGVMGRVFRFFIVCKKSNAGRQLFAPPHLPPQICGQNTGIGERIGEL